MKTNFKNQTAAWLTAALFGLSLGVAGNVGAAEKDEKKSSQLGEYKTLKGEIIPLYTFLTGQQVHSQKPEYWKRGDLSYQTDKDADKRQGQRPNAQTEQSQTGAESADQFSRDRQNTENSDPSAEQTRQNENLANRESRLSSQWNEATSMRSNQDQPMIMLAKEEKLFGSDQECYLLLFDPNNASTEQAFRKAHGMAKGAGSQNYASTSQDQTGRLDSRDAANRNKDQVQVRDQKETDPNKTQDKYESKSKSKTTAAEMPGKQMASVSGHVVEKDGIKAIVVSNFSFDNSIKTETKE